MAAAALVAAAVWAQQHGGPIEIAGHPRVIDGVTIAFGRAHVRLYGVAAPESDQTCSNAAGELYPCDVLATSVMLKLVEGERIICRADLLNLHRRFLATCWRGDLDLGREMVREGQAIAYGDFSTIYTADGDQARAERRGIWTGPVAGELRARRVARRQ